MVLMAFLLQTTKKNANQQNFSEMGSKVTVFNIK
jgi:hypothetical protein